MTLTLEAETGLAGDPEDIMLVLDRSASMAGALPSLKTAANGFVDIIDEATDGVLDGAIANGSRVGIVSFATSATLDVPLTTDATALKTAINALVAAGNTNHSAAISLAQSTLAGSEPTNSKQMIMFTDGVTTVGGDGQAEAAAARTAGTEIFAIGLGSVNTAQLNGWASDPDADHVFIAPTRGDLEEIFEAIGAAIVVPAATNVSIVDTVDSHFAVSTPTASKGTVIQAGNVLTWTIPELGTETVTLTFTATHNPALPGGVEQVNDSVAYTDTEGHTVSFGNPSVNVRGCPAHIDLTRTRHERAHDRGIAHGDREGDRRLRRSGWRRPRLVRGHQRPECGTDRLRHDERRRDDDVHVLTRRRVLEPRARHHRGMLRQRRGSGRVRHGTQAVGRHDSA